jgi:hypothetical protein
MLKIQQKGARAEGKVHAAALKKVGRQKTAATAISIAGAIPPVGRAMKAGVAGIKGAYAAGKSILTRAARGHAKNQARLAKKDATKKAVRAAFQKKKTASDAHTKADRKSLGIKPGNKNRKKSSPANEIKGAKFPEHAKKRLMKKVEEVFGDYKSAAARSHSRVKGSEKRPPMSAKPKQKNSSSRRYDTKGREY